MTQLDAIRIRLEHIRQGHVPPLSGSLPEWYCQDIALLLAVASAALAYEEATQIPDGVQQAEQSLFSALAPLKESV